jgi:hypothetical protein
MRVHGTVTAPIGLADLTPPIELHDQIAEQLWNPNQALYATIRPYMSRRGMRRWPAISPQSIFRWSRRAGTALLQSTPEAAPAPGARHAHKAQPNTRATPAPAGDLAGGPFQSRGNLARSPAMSV